MTPKEQICDYCRDFNTKGWMPGCSGGMSILSDLTPNNRSILISPDNISKTDLKMGDIFELRFDFAGSRTIAPPKSNNQEPHVIAKLAPLYLSIFQQKPGVRSIIESCSEWAVLVGELALKLWENNAENFPDELRFRHVSLIKNIEGFNNSSELILPIVENDPIEDLLHKVPEIVKKHPHVPGLLIRHHGLLVWGSSPEKARLNAEYLHYLCQFLINRHRYIESPTGHTL